MDRRFLDLGFAANSSQNAFKYLGGSMQVGGAARDYGMDTALRLDSAGASFSYLSSPKGVKRKWNLIDGSVGPYVGREFGSPLLLGLHKSSSSSDSKGSSAATGCTAISSAEEESSMDLELDFTLHLGNEKVPNTKISGSTNLKALDFYPKVDLELSLSTGPTESDITSVHPGSSQHQMHLGPHIDDETTSSRRRAEMSSTLNTSSYTETSSLFNQVQRKQDPIPSIPDLSSSVITKPKSSVTCTSGISHQQQQLLRNSGSKTCQFKGCGKGARGASGLCIAHGGGRRCQKSGCHKGAEGRTVYCKAHGGGRRCEHLGCTKSAEGRTDFCIAHGGGRRCSHEGCTRAARGRSGLCIRHGGGKRCQRENCTKSAEGLSGLCISHGGGRRCQFPQCTKGAQGSTMYCKAHGGGKRCTVTGCTKGAEGSTPYCKGHGGGKRCAFQGGGVCPKSVHGGTHFCVAHGGGKRCAVPECTKSARGRTDYCVRHGGGKRCKFEGCGKSAQGSTDFCKAHGGGKRCSWGQLGSEFGQGDSPCDKFARGKTGLCVSHSAQVQDKRIHGGDTLGPLVQDPNLSKTSHMIDDMHVDIMNVVGPRNGIESKQFGVSRSIGEPSAPVSVPEGRVHGGSLMAMLAGGSGLGSSGSKGPNGGPREARKSYMAQFNWA